MKILPLLAAAAVLLASPAFAQSLGEKTGVNSAVGISPKTPDFVTEAATTDMLEIAEAKLAQQQGTDTVKPFAEKMITDHTETTNALKALISDGKVKAQPPADMTRSQKSQLDKLSKMHGADFNRQYARDAVSVHKTAVSLFQRYAKGGDNPDLKAFAAKYLPVVQMHLKMAQDLNKAPASTMGQGAGMGQGAK
jgi:putative membrane protein